MSDRGRILLIAAVVVIVGLILSGRFFAGFYVDYLWHTSLGRGDVFWGVLRTKVLLFVLFAGAFSAMAILNLLIADRLSPVSFSANTHPSVERFHEFFGKRLRLFRIAVAVVVGMLFAAPAIGRWQQWMMFRNSKAFGISDPQFQHDIGFYLFKLPFITFLLDWLFAALLFVTLLTVATHVLNGGIVVQPPRPKVRNAAKAHVAVLLAALALVKAGDYWVQRYELTAENRAGAIVRGATYTEINAHLPAIEVLGLVALLTAALFLYTLRSGSWRVPVVASALWAVFALVGGVIYPATVQALLVNPNQRDREAVYIERNVVATRNALGIANVEKVDTTVGEISTQQVEDGSSSLENVRLLKADSDMVTRYRSDQGLRTGLTINDLDIDRYVIDGREQQVVLGARELDLSSVANKTWQGQHLISTHGCGLVFAPAGQVDTNGRPVYQEADLARPELYFSDEVGGYAIVRSQVKEETCPNQADPGPYEGTGGVKLDSTFKRLAFALDYLDYNLIGSSAVDDDSRLIATRRVQDRVRTLAPFLAFDGDPYPVALNGKVYWVVDGYTTSDLYPYGENGDRAQLDATSGLSQPFNYVRNSVKAVVDAYDGTTTFYAVDQVDPVLKVWASAFPGLFRPMGDMPEGLNEHLRYPEELFRIQTAAYSKYQLEPDAFFDRIGAWSVAQAPPAQAQAATPVGAPTTETAANQQQAFSDDSGSARFVPYYSMFKAPDQDEASFQLFRPYVKFSTNDDRRELQAFMTASSDPETYGKLTAYTVADPLPNGPLQVANTMAQEPTISEQVTLIDQRGSQVVLGDLQMVPIEGGVVWIRPLFIEPPVGGQPLLAFVLASYNGQAAYGGSIGEAISKLFAGFDKDLGDRVDVGNEPPGSGTGTPSIPDGSTTSTTTPASGGSTPTTRPGSATTTPGVVAGTPEELLAEADRLFAEADTALKAGDLGTYQSKVTAARDLVTRARDAIATATAPTSTTPTSASPSATSPTTVAVAGGGSTTAPPSTVATAGGSATTTPPS